jgi:hypothetical protein
LISIVRDEERYVDGTAELDETHYHSFTEEPRFMVVAEKTV